MPVVAIDAGPLHGPRTGVGNAVAGTLEALLARDGVRTVDGAADAGTDDDAGTDTDTDTDDGADPDDGRGGSGDELVLAPYVTSMRSRLRDGERRLPLPAALAHRLWARTSAVPMDRWLGHPDVVHGTNYVVPPARAARLVSVYDCWFLEHTGDVDPDVARAASVLRRSVADGAHVVTSSEATRVRVRDLLGTDRVHTVRLGSPLPVEGGGRRPASLEVPVDAPFVLALGTVERRKNLTTLVRAFSRLAAGHRTVHLVIAGAAGDDSGAVGSAISRLPLDVSARIHVIGPVHDEAKRWLLTNARTLAYPSLDEGFGFPILEAHAAGTPVVASSAGSIPEIAGPAALLSLPSDPDALAANLRWVVDDDDRHDSLVRLGRRNVARFSWRRTASELHALYLTLADGA